MVYGDLERRIVTARNKHVLYAFLLHRSPFRVSVHGQTVHLSADVEYSGRVWYDSPFAPVIEVSCGTDKESPRRATLTLESTGALTEDWNLRTKSRVLKLAAYSDSARDRCRLTFMRIDVTQNVLTTTRWEIGEKLASFDDAVAHWAVRRRFEKIWRTLQKPMRLADSVYMTINPTAAQLGALGAHGNSAYANLRLFAIPHVTTGPRPRVEYGPLPPLQLANDVGRGARVLIDASFAYPVATVILRRALVDHRLEQSGHRIRIRDVAIVGIGGGKVALGVRLSGAVRGRLYFTGTPGYEPLTHEITVPDLDYDVGTAQILVKGYEWLNNVTLRDFLRERARIPDSTVMNRLSQLAEQGMNRDLPARGTHLSGHIGQANMVAVSATLREIRIRTVADADLKLSINRAPSIPRPPDRAREGKDESESEDDAE